MDTLELTRKIAETAAELNTLIAKLPSGYKVEIDVTEINVTSFSAMSPHESIQHVAVTVYKRLGGNRQGT